MSGVHHNDASSSAEVAAGVWLPGLVLGNHALVRRIGVGGMAEVFEAEHSVLRTRVAIKRLHGRASARREAVARFLREGRAAAVIRHPHVVQILDVGAHDGAPYLVMEFLEGVDLESHLAARGALAAEEAIDLLLPVLSAVQAAHAEGVLHRDLKPSNVVLARGRGSRVRPVVVDFGVARATRDLVEGPLTADEALLGTPAYLAPELCQGASAASAASDQYALGVMLYQCLAGRRPFDAPSLPRLFAAIERSEYAPLNTIRDDIPSALEEALDRAIARASADRHADVAAFARALLPFASAEGRARWESLEAGTVERAPSEPPAVAPEPTPLISPAAAVANPSSPARSRVWAAAIAAGVALAALTLLRPRVAGQHSVHPTLPPITAPLRAATSATPPVTPSPLPPALPPASAPSASAPHAPAPLATPARPALRRTIVRRAHHLAVPASAPGCIGPNGVNLCL